jgi:hypothetical protein
MQEASSWGRLAGAFLAKPREASHGGLRSAIDPTGSMALPSSAEKRNQLAGVLVSPPSGCSSVRAPTFSRKAA